MFTPLNVYLFNWGVAYLTGALCAMRSALCAYSYEPPAIDLNYPNDPNDPNDPNEPNDPNSPLWKSKDSKILSAGKRQGHY